MDQPEIIEWLTSLYGVNPQDVGKEDGTEDDFGDLMTDIAFALAYENDDVPNDLIQAITDSRAETMAALIAELAPQFVAIRQIWRSPNSSMLFQIVRVEDRFAYVKLANDTKKSLANPLGGHCVARSEFREWKFSGIAETKVAR